MRQRVLRRLEVLEKEYRSHEERKLSSLRTARMHIWRIVLAYYLGDLEIGDSALVDADLWEACARALKFPSDDDFCEVLRRNDVSEFEGRFIDAYRRLFAKAGLDFDEVPLSVLFDAFVTMVDQLPDPCLKWLRSNLQRWCRDAEIAVGSNLPRHLSPDNLFQ
jgi:hypothetical protein